MTETMTTHGLDRARSDQDRAALWNQVLDTVIVILFFVGVILTPIHFREPILFKKIGYLGYINFPCTLAVLLSLLRIRRWKIQDVLLFGAWLLLLIPMMVSNLAISRKRAVTAVFQNLLPALIVFYRMEPASRKRTVRIWLICFDVFIILLLALGIEERFNGHMLLKAARDWLVQRHYDASEISRYIIDGRFSSVWGHPLTMSMFFNAFFIANVVYRRQNGQKCPVILYFAITLAGVLLSASRSGLVVCFGLLVVSCWKQKKWFLLAIPVMAILYFTGAFKTVITRFGNRALFDDDRIRELTGYFASGINPLKWLTGYGSNTVLMSGNPVYQFNDGFEFPLLMYAYDYGIVFAVVRILGMYGYVTWRFLRRRQWLPWICFSALFAQLNVYNGYAMRNQDICFLMDFFAMILLNMVPDEERADNPGRHEARVSVPDRRMEPLARRALPATLSVVVCAWMATFGLMYINAHTQQPLTLTWGTLQRNEVTATEVIHEARESFTVQEEITAEKLSLIPYLWDTSGTYQVSLLDETTNETLTGALAKFPIKKSGKVQELTLDRPATLVPGRAYQLNISVKRKEASKSKKSAAEEETAKSPFTGFGAIAQEGKSFVTDEYSETGVLCFSLNGLSRDLTPLRLWAIAVPAALCVLFCGLFLLLPRVLRKQKRES